VSPFYDTSPQFSSSKHDRWPLRCFAGDCLVAARCAHRQVRAPTRLREIRLSRTRPGGRRRPERGATPDAGRPRSVGRPQPSGTGRRCRSSPMAGRQTLLAGRQNATSRMPSWSAEPAITSPAQAAGRVRIRRLRMPGGSAACRVPMTPAVQSMVAATYVRDIDTARAFYELVGFREHSAGKAATSAWSAMHQGQHRVLLTSTRPPLDVPQLPLLPTSTSPISALPSGRWRRPGGGRRDPGQGVGVRSSPARRRGIAGFRPAAAVDAQLPDTPAGKPRIKL
jgi:hypothetical protein